MLELSIIIINWNSGLLLRECISTMISAENFDENKTEIIVIDNQSTDNSLDQLPNSSLLKVVRNKKNLGFGKASNQGASLAKGEYILFLNPDIKFSSPAILPALTKLKTANFHVLGIKQINNQGEVQRSCCRKPVLSTFINQTVGFYNISRRLFPSFKMVEWDHLESRLVDHVIGSFYMLERDLFWNIGGFDEDYFLFYEDLDLSWRILEAGKKIYYYTEHEVLHLGGGTTNQIKAKRYYYSIQSKHIFSKKHFSFISHFLYTTILLIIEPLARIFEQMLKFKIKDIKNIAAGYGLFLLYLLKTLSS